MGALSRPAWGSSSPQRGFHIQAFSSGASPEPPVVPSVCVVAQDGPGVPTVGGVTRTSVNGDPYRVDVLQVDRLQFV